MPDRQTGNASLVRNDITSRRHALALLAGLLATPAVVLVAPDLAAQTAPKQLKVVASFSILADLARVVGGERVSVDMLVGPNADAHVYRPAPQDAAKLKEADLVIVNGLGFDGFMPRLIRSSGSKARIVTATAGLKPLEKRKGGDSHGHSHGHDHARVDPHAWQSIEAVKLFVGNLRDGLVAADGAGEASYRANAERYLAELTALKVELEGIFAGIPPERRVVLTNHDAFGYFAREFSFRFEAVQGISTEAAPSAQDVARVIRAAKEKKAGAVFVENMSDPRIAERLAKETGAKLGGTLYSDALSDAKGPASTYITMMRHNAQALAGALRQ